MISLAEYRKQMRFLAITRDGGLCMICKWVHHRERDAQEVHHVFGRGTSNASVKEYYTSLMSVCIECHPQPILLPPTMEWQATILRVWRNMNCDHHNKTMLIAPELVVDNPVGLSRFNISDGLIYD